MVRIMKFVWNCVQPLLFLHCIAFLLLILNQSMLLLVMEGYFKRLLEIAVWPVVDIVTESFCESDPQEDRIWDPGWARAFVGHIAYAIRFFGCLICLPLHYSPITRALKEIIHLFLDFLRRHIYEFLTFENLTYIYLVAFFANKLLSRSFRRLKNSLIGVPIRTTTNNFTTGALSHQQQQYYYYSDSSCTITDDDDDDDDDYDFYDGDDDDDDSASLLLVNNLGFLPLRRRRSYLERERMCCMCSHFGDHSVLLPCGHTDLCFNCSWSYHIMNLACPFCATQIQSCHRILL